MSQRIVNATVHSSIGMSPYQLLYGDTINLEEGIFIPFKTPDATPLNELITQAIATRQSLMESASKHQDRINTKHLSNVPESITSYPIGSYVTVSYPDNILGRPPSKFHTKRKGPYKVVGVQGPTYSLHNAVTDKVESHHVTWLQPFLYNPTKINPDNIARAEAQEYQVERIVTHQGDPTRKSSLDFMVKWVGYDDAENLWLPWSELRNNPILHEYLRNKGMSNLVPDEFRLESEKSRRRRASSSVSSSSSKKETTHKRKRLRPYGDS